MWYGQGLTFFLDDFRSARASSEMVRVHSITKSKTDSHRSKIQWIQNRWKATPKEKTV